MLRRVVWTGLVVLVLGFAACSWRYYHLEGEMAQRRLYALGHAMAAYIDAHGGQMPDSIKSLSASRFIRTTSPDRFIVTAPPVRAYRWHLAPPLTEVRLSDYDIAWSRGVTRGNKPFITPKSQRWSLPRKAEAINENLCAIAGQARKRGRE
jgi:hypothetical protein